MIPNLAQEITDFAEELIGAGKERDEESDDRERQSRQA